MLHHFYIKGIPEALVSLGVGDAVCVVVWKGLETLTFYRRESADLPSLEIDELVVLLDCGECPTLVVVAGFNSALKRNALVSIFACPVLVKSSSYFCPRPYGFC